MKPLIHPTNISAINELLKLVLEFGNLENVKIVFVFSEKASLLFQLLIKYNLDNKITYLCDPTRKVFEKFQIQKIYKKFCESEQRNTHIFCLKGNKILNSIEFGRFFP
jgi:hypothetical protein